MELILLEITLLGIIALAEVLRLVVTYRPVSKKQHFKQKFEGVTKMIWDLEFKAFKTREIREDVRREYDQSKARLSAIEEQIIIWPKDKDEGDRKRLEDKVVLQKRDVERFEAQMKQLDLEVNGAKPTVDYPDGVQGINHQVDSLQELKGMLEEWIQQM